MALPIEQLTQRAGKTMVVYQHDHLDDSSAETLWAATTDFGAQTITMNEESNADYSNREAVDARLSVVDEVQSITITGTPNDGTFTLSFNGDETAGIAYNAGNAAIETALEGLEGIGSDNVVVAGAAFPAGVKTVTFTGDLSGVDVPLLVADGDSLSGGTNPAVAVHVVTEGFSR